MLSLQAGYGLWSTSGCCMEGAAQPLHLAQLPPGSNDTSCRYMIEWRTYVSRFDFLNLLKLTSSVHSWVIQWAKAVGSGASSLSQQSCLYLCPPHVKTKWFINGAVSRPPDVTYTVLSTLYIGYHGKQSMELDLQHHLSLWAHWWWWSQSPWPHFHFNIIVAPILHQQQCNTQPC